MEYNNQIEHLKNMLESGIPNDEIIKIMTYELKELENDLPCGVNFIIKNKKGEILLVKRKSTLGSGTWGLCGGHLKKFETFEEASIRESFEELGIVVDIKDVEVISFAESSINVRYLQIGVLIKKYKGTPIIKELNKVSEIGWFSKNNLPDNLFFGTKPQIMLYFKNKFYDKDENIFIERK